MSQYPIVSLAPSSAVFNICLGGKTKGENVAKSGSGNLSPKRKGTIHSRFRCFCASFSESGYPIGTVPHCMLYSLQKMRKDCNLQMRERHRAALILGEICPFPLSSPSISHAPMHGHLFTKMQRVRRRRRSGAASPRHAETLTRRRQQTCIETAGAGMNGAISYRGLMMRFRQQRGFLPWSRLINRDVHGC